MTLPRERPSAARTMLAIVFAAWLPAYATPAVARVAEPHPRLEDLPANTALDLGQYECAKRVPQFAEGCHTIFDYSRFNYDPYGHRLLMFGGGHSASGRTDIDVFDLRTLRWRSLYPSMSCEEVRAHDLHPLGYHRATGHPVARHTYDQSVIVPTGPDSGELMLFSTEGFEGYCHRKRSQIKSVAAYPLSREPVEESGSRWRHIETRIVWAFAATAEYDPVSKHVVMIGNGFRSGGGLMVFDPATAHTVVVNGVKHSHYDHNLVYFPPNDTFYLIQRGRKEGPGMVRRLVLDRSDWTRSRTEVVATTGPLPSTPKVSGWAYDSTNHVIGGGVVDGAFHTFDPATGVIERHVIEARSKDGAKVGTGSFHHLDYDPVNNVFFFVTRAQQGEMPRMWAYRLAP